MGALGNPVGELAAAGGFIVTMEAYKRLLDAKMLEEQTAVARVFRCDDIGSPKRLHSTERYILAVADGGWNDAQHGEREALPAFRQAGGKVVGQINGSIRETLAFQRLKVITAEEGGIAHDFALHKDSTGP